jgi:methionine-rich copper-binding protein CopC
MKMRRNFVIAISLLIAVQPSIYPASAHSKLVSSNPAANQVLTSSASNVILNFNEKILVLENQAPNKIDLLRAKTGIAIKGKLVVKSAQVKLALNQKLEAGKYQVKYRVVSEDGHPVQGSYYFTVK